MKRASIKLLLGLTSAILLLFNQKALSQNSVGIGTTTPNTNAVLDLRSPSNNQGLLIPSLSTEQRVNSTFTNNLNSNDNGLLVFDLTEKAFYYWQDTNWVNLQSATQLTAGEGIAISGNTIENTGDKDSTNELQDLTLNSSGNIRDISLTNGEGISFSVADEDSSSTNEIQDLLLVGSTLSITNNSSATNIDLSPFLGTDTDDQNLTLTNSGVNRTINITDGTGVTFSVADNDNNSTNELQNLNEVLNRSNDAGNNTIINLGNPVNITDAANKRYVDNSIFSGNFNDLSGIPAGLADGDDTGLTAVTSDATLTGTGTSASPLSIANNSITTARLANSSVTNAKINDVAPSKISAGGATTGQALLWNGANWAPQNINSSVFNTANILPKGNGTTQVASRIFDDGSALRIGRTTSLNSTSFYDIELPITGTSYGGFNFNSTSATGRPYLGFWLNNTLQTYLFQDGSDAFRIYTGSGTAFSIDNARNVGIGTTVPTARLDVVGNTELNGALITPAAGTTTINSTNYNLPTPTRRIVRVAGVAGIPSRISTITAGADGQEVILINTSNTSVAVTGAVEPTSSNSVILDNLGVTLGKYSTLHLIYDGTLNVWVEVSRSINEYILN